MDKPAAIIGKYSCEVCGIVERPLSLPLRQEGEDIREYMDKVIIEVSENHSAKSPNCRAKKLSKLFIPMSADGSSIGSP